MIHTYIYVHKWVKPLSHLSDTTRTGFHTSLCWPQAGVRGLPWLSSASSLKCKRNVCWMLCSTLVEFLGPHGKNAQQTGRRMNKNDVIHWRLLDTGNKRGVKRLLFPDRAMSSLYGDPQWSTNMTTAVSRLSDPGVELEQALAWLHERAKEEYFSLSDIWGGLIGAGIMKQVPEQHYFNIKCSTQHVNK